MPKKLTIEYVKQRTIEIAEDYECLSDVYINAHIKLLFKCDKNHEFKMIWNSFQQGQRCLTCAPNKKLTLEYIKQETKRLACGYRCLSDEYKNSQIKLKFTCPKDHIFKMRWNSFQQGYRCLICAGNKKLSIEYVKQKTIELAKGYECLSDIYTNSGDKLIFKCDKGHTYKAIWASFQSGNRCPMCSKYCNKYTIDSIKQKVIELESGYNCISKIYKTAHILLKFKCNSGHEFKMRWNDFKKGHRCPICYKENNKGKNHPSWKGGVVKNNIPLFDTYASQLDFCEEVRRDSENTDYLQVKCTESNCEKWFRPTRIQVVSRICSLNKLVDGENRFYCSDKCKNSCSIFRQRASPKGFINKNSIRYDQAEWASMVKERDNFECQKCGATDNLEAHHIEGLVENPIESADIDIGITLCADCHKLAHEDDGCRFVDMRNNNCGRGLYAI